jgi:hypothetical protein
MPTLFPITSATALPVLFNFLLILITTWQMKYTICLLYLYTTCLSFCHHIMSSQRVDLPKVTNGRGGSWILAKCIREWYSTFMSPNFQLCEFFMEHLGIIVLPRNVDIMSYGGNLLLITFYVKT